MWGMKRTLPHNDIYTPHEKNKFEQSVIIGSNVSAAYEAAGVTKVFQQKLLEILYEYPHAYKRRPFPARLG